MRFVCSSVALMLTITACGGDTATAVTAEVDEVDPAPVAADHQDDGHDQVKLPASRRDAEAPLIGTSGERLGEVVVSNGPHGMVIRVMATSIAHGFHGAHLHKVGDCSDPEAGFKAASTHVNLTGEEHGLLNPAGYHRGASFPNVYAADNGHLHVELFANGLTLEQANDADGFSLIIHTDEDDHITQPIGGAGARIACAAFNP